MIYLNTSGSVICLFVVGKKKLLYKIYFIHKILFPTFVPQFIINICKIVDDERISKISVVIFFLSHQIGKRNMKCEFQAEI